MEDKEFFFGLHLFFSTFFLILSKKNTNFATAKSV